jgi:hypothetical protein
MGGSYRNSARYPSPKINIIVIPAQAGTPIHAPARIGKTPAHQTLVLDELGSSQRWNDAMWRIVGTNLSPPPNLRA